MKRSVLVARKMQQPSTYPPALSLRPPHDTLRSRRVFLERRQIIQSPPSSSRRSAAARASRLRNRRCSCQLGDASRSARLTAAYPPADASPAADIFCPTLTRADVDAGEAAGEAAREARARVADAASLSASDDFALDDFGVRGGVVVAVGAAVDPFPKSRAPPERTEPFSSSVVSFSSTSPSLVFFPRVAARLSRASARSAFLSLFKSAMTRSRLAIFSTSSSLLAASSSSLDARNVFN